MSSRNFEDIMLWSNLWMYCSNAFQSVTDILDVRSISLKCFISVSNSSQQKSPVIEFPV